MIILGFDKIKKKYPGTGALWALKKNVDWKQVAFEVFFGLGTLDCFEE